MVRPVLEVTKTGWAVLFVALLPDIEEGSGDSEKAAGLTDVAAQAAFAVR